MYAPVEPAEGWTRGTEVRVMMAPPPWSFGVQTLEPVSSRSPSLGQRHLEGLHISLKAQGTPPSTLTLQTLGPEDFSCVLEEEPGENSPWRLTPGLRDCCWWLTHNYQSDCCSQNG